MMVDGHQNDKTVPLRILVVGATERSAADLISGLAEADDVEFAESLSGVKDRNIASASIDVIVLSAHDTTAPVTKLTRDVGPGLSGVPTIALCNGSSERVVEWLGATEIDDVDRAPIPRALLVARIERIRRSRPPTPLVGAPAPPSVMTFGPIRLDPAAHEVSVNGTPLQLTPTEYKLLELMMRHSGECLSRDTILDGVWGINFDTGTNLVDMYIYFVRKRLKARGLTGVVRTVRGSGYRFVSPDQQ